MARRVLIVLSLLALAGCDASRVAPGMEALGAQRARVVRVVDGDTVVVQVGARRETVRLIGIDTPETHRPGTPVQCGGPAATRALQRLLLTPDGRGRSVTLAPDPTQDRRDRYGRLLAYVDLVAGGRDAGEELLRAGRAEVYLYRDHPFLRVLSYRTAEREARERRRGNWALCG